MTTFTGRCIDFRTFSADDVCLEDIAHHLASVNRFGGAARIPMSVAQHSVLVSRLSGSYGSPLAVHGLLHDAAEAYLGDVIKWLKCSDAFAGYRELERHIEKIIWAKFGLPH